MEVPLRIIYRKTNLPIKGNLLDRIEYTLNHFRELTIESITLTFDVIAFHLFNMLTDECCIVGYTNNSFYCSECQKRDCPHILYIIIEVSGVYPTAEYLLNNNRFDNYHDEYFKQCMELEFDISI